MNQPYPQQYAQPPGYPQQPQYPAQPAPPQYQQPVQPQYPVAPQQPGYPAQQPYGGYPQQAPAPAPVQTVNGTLDDFYNQPSTGGGPSISWANKDGSKKPIGTWYAGVVARDVTNGDIQQQINFQSKQPEFYADGRPKFVMKVPLTVDPQQHPEFEDGEAAFFVRGQARDELSRAMQEAGASGAPKKGDFIVVQLVQRKPNGQGRNPSNVVQITYTPANASTAPQAAAPQPVQQPVEQTPPPAPQPQQAQAPVPPPAPVQQGPAPTAPPAPVQQAPVQAAPQPPANLTADQQQLISQLAGQGQPGQPAA